MSRWNLRVGTPGGVIYGLGILGALVFFLQRANEPGEFVWAIVQGLFWPAFMVYEAFAAFGA